MALFLPVFRDIILFFFLQIYQDVSHLCVSHLGRGYFYEVLFS